MDQGQQVDTVCRTSAFIAAGVALGCHLLGPMGLLSAAPKEFSFCLVLSGLSTQQASAPHVR